MTDILNLLAGICVIIDDGFIDRGNDDKIWIIKKSLEEKGLPILTYNTLPENEVIKNFVNSSFIILDWELKQEGISIPDDQKIDFIRQLFDFCFIPIFIFSNEDPHSIIRVLEENDVFSTGKSNIIFVKRKSDIPNSEKIFEEISNWLKSTPSAYVLKE